jgi:hypothetical protein
MLLLGVGWHVIGGHLGAPQTIPLGTLARPLRIPRDRSGRVDGQASTEWKAGHDGWRTHLDTGVRASPSVRLLQPVGRIGLPAVLLGSLGDMLCRWMCGHVLWRSSEGRLRPRQLGSWRPYRQGSME